MFPYHKMIIWTEHWLHCFYWKIMQLVYPSYAAYFVKLAYLWGRMPVINIGDGRVRKGGRSASDDSSQQEICGFEYGNLMFTRWALLRGDLECSPKFISSQFQELILFRETEREVPRGTYGTINS